VGDYEAVPLGTVESLLKYHPFTIWNLTSLDGGHCMEGSLTGVVASKSVTEAFKGTLSTLSNRA
jgi:hypothetical protein